MYANTTFARNSQNLMDANISGFTVIILTNTHALKMKINLGQFISFHRVAMPRCVEFHYCKPIKVCYPFKFANFANASNLQTLIDTNLYFFSMILEIRKIKWM